MKTLDLPSIKFHTSASKLKECPPSISEVAFAGRSNAGKSSAINAITEQRGLARTSKTPGRTQLINFFEINEKRFLVDLPGYGFAKVPLAVKNLWQKELEKYLRQRQQLTGLILLSDIRHPLKEFDRSIITWARESDLPIHILLTKADKLKHGAAKSTLLEINKEQAIKGRVSVQLFSALKGDGIKEVRKLLENWLFF